MRREWIQNVTFYGASFVKNVGSGWENETDVNKQQRMVLLLIFKTLEKVYVSEGTEVVLMFKSSIKMYIKFSRPSPHETILSS